MDKTEYRMKLDEINDLVDAQDYEGALQIADTIDWRRVKSIRTLCMVADIYEVNGKLESSMKMLQLAYKRSSVGKMILYRLVELCLKMGRADEAVSYYNEYLETASNDTSKYILKYKILKAQNAPLEDQIQVLEEYREREYTERWVYELAKLYKRAGKEHKCVETCDDLILWFGEGKYVTKAMELKMTYTPLTVSQREKYEKAVATSGKRMESAAKPSEPAVTEKVLDKPAEGRPVLAMDTAAAAVEAAPKAETAPEASQTDTEKAGADAAVDDTVGEKKAEEPVSTDTDSEDSVQAQTPQVDAGKIRENSVQLQERLAKSFQEVLSGIHRNRAVASMENLGKAAGTEPLKIPEEEENISDYQVKDLKPETAAEDKISGEKGEAIAHRTERPQPPVKEKTEKPEDKEITSVNEVDLEALFAETSSMIAETIGAVKSEKEPEEISETEVADLPVDAEQTEEAAVPETEDAPEKIETAEENADVEEETASTESQEVEEVLAAEDSAEAEEAVNSEKIAESADTAVPEESVEPEKDAGSEEKEQQDPEDFSDIEAALAQAAQGFMQEAEQADDEQTDASVEVKEAGEQEEDTAAAEESDAEEAADLDAERAMEAFAASLDQLDDGPSEEKEEETEEEEHPETDGEAPAEEEKDDIHGQTDDDAEAAMAAFEASLDLGIEQPSEETEDAEASVEPEAEEIEETAEAEIQDEEAEEEAEVEIQDEETEEEAEADEDPFVSAVSGNTGELDIEAQLRAVLGEQDKKESSDISDDELARELFGDEASKTVTEQDDALEEGLSQTEIIEEVPVEEEDSREEDTDEVVYEEPYAEVSDDAEEADEESEESESESEEVADIAEKQEDASGDEEMDFTPDIDLNIVLEANKEKEEAQEQLNIDMLLEEAEAEPEMPSSIPEGETPEEKRIRIMNATRPDRLTDQQKKLFSYFAKIPGMDQQILDAINGAYSHSGERTSHRGNIAIMGSHGTGKSRLSDGLVKALCKELGLPAAKYARLDASDMNSKDPARVVAKLSGGFLLIERAGHMSADTIDRLSRAMDFRTDSLIVIIEDDKTSMRRLLSEYPEFAEKFATVISIPVFTNDELVTFARTYARENGYRMDEMGVLALYTLIGNNQREDEPITVGKVKEMVDGAIRRAGGGLKLGRKISKRHTDEEGRIYLYEKDFNL